MTAAKLIITLDGPSGSGKSTVSIRLARYFKIPCLDTGAMYRALGVEALKLNLSLGDEPALQALAEKMRFRFGFEGETPFAEVSVEGKSFRRLGNEIRTPEASKAASAVAKLPNLRAVLVRMQQEIGNRDGGVIEGRDAGTVIFPKATTKFFITASSQERAKRRHLELQEKLGSEVQSYEDVLREMILRDRQDEERAASPSKPAADAVIVDTSNRSLDEVFQYLVDQVKRGVAKN